MVCAVGRVVGVAGVAPGVESCADEPVDLWKQRREAMETIVREVDKY